MACSWVIRSLQSRPSEERGRQSVKKEKGGEDWPQHKSDISGKTNDKRLGTSVALSLYEWKCSVIVGSPGASVRVLKLVDDSNQTDCIPIDDKGEVVKYTISLQPDND